MDGWRDASVITIAVLPATVYAVFPASLSDRLPFSIYIYIFFEGIFHVEVY